MATQRNGDESYVGCVGLQWKLLELAQLLLSRVAGRARSL